MLDFNRYASDGMIGYVNRQAEIIRRNCPDTKITTNVWFCTNIPNFYDEFSSLDFISYDNYPTTRLPDNPEECYSHAFHLDLMRGVKRSSFWVMEQLSGGLGCWAPMGRTPLPGMLKGYALQAFAHGADISGYKIIIAPEMYVKENGVAEKLYEFTENGGTLILTNRSGVKDEHNNCIMEQLPTMYRKDEHLNPPVVTYVDGKFAGQRKWQIMWDENSYDMLTKLRDPTKFEFLFDDVYGFNDELSYTIMGNMFNEIAFNGGSWTQLSNENKPLIDGIIEKYQ